MVSEDLTRLDRDRIVAIQRQALGLLADRLSRSPQWREHFSSAGMVPEDLKAADGLSNAPFLGKPDLRARYPFPFLTVDVERVERFMATSGTTGQPVLFGMTARDYFDLLPRQMRRILEAAGVRRGMRAYQGYGYGLWIGGPALDVGFRTMACPTVPLGPGRGELAARWLRDHAYEVASMSPLWLMSLLSHAREQGIDPKIDWSLKLAILGGQSVSTEFRAQLEAQLPDGFRSRNIYGTTEAGGPILAISTEESHDSDELQLVNEDTVLTEFLDPETLKPVGPGEVGEIVVTTLGREASPVVRWRTHDLVRLPANPYASARYPGMPRIGRIIGRSDDMLKVKGVIVFPSQIEDIVTAVPGTVKEAWQIYFDRDATTFTDLHVAVEADPALARPGDQIEADIAREIRSRLGIGARIVCSPHGTLPRYEAKAVRVLPVSALRA